MQQAALRDAAGLPISMLGRQALASLGAPAGYDRTAAGGRHACAETVPTLAHELARLVGPFHVGSPFTLNTLRVVQGNIAGTRKQPRRHSGAIRTHSGVEVAALIGSVPNQVNRAGRPRRTAQTHQIFSHSLTCA